MLNNEYTLMPAKYEYMNICGDQYIRKFWETFRGPQTDKYINQGSC